MHSNNRAKYETKLKQTGDNSAESVNCTNSNLRTPFQTVRNVTEKRFVKRNKAHVIKKGHENSVEKISYVIEINSVQNGRVNLSIRCLK